MLKSRLIVSFVLYIYLYMYITHILKNPTTKAFLFFSVNETYLFTPTSFSLPGFVCSVSN